VLCHGGSDDGDGGVVTLGFRSAFGLEGGNGHREVGDSGWFWVDLSRPVAEMCRVFLKKKFPFRLPKISKMQK
jgi:hypothetical protein